MLAKLLKWYSFRKLLKMQKEVASLKANITDWIQDIIKKHNDQESRLRDVEARLIKIEQERMEPYRGFF